MKFTLPSFAWFALGACVALAQPAGNYSGQTLPADRPAALTASTAGMTGSASGYSQRAGEVGPSSEMTAMPANGAADGGNLFMQRVAAAADQLRSVQARIRFRTDLFGQQTVGAGEYLQLGQGDERQYRLELKTAVGQEWMTLEQVCDGKFLWGYQNAVGKQKANASDRPIISKLDLRKVRQALEDSGNNSAASLMGPGGVGSGPAGALAVGGLPRLLDGLQKSFRFMRVEEGKLDAMPVWIATGTWRSEALMPLSKVLADQAAHDQPLDLKLLPPQIPEQVWLYVGQDDFFPYRIEFRRRAGGKGKAGEGKGAEPVPIVMIEFYEVRLNGEIDRRNFDYNPGDAQIVDTTANYVKALGGAQ